jgi:glycosyltransferase involved in cell wall biosynthesis/predicted metal-dependent phosphoesterase TrpH
MTLDTTTTRVDMHCHSTASQISKLGVQRALGLPECATPPEEVYELAKRRGMDFVTITDHDTIDGVLEISGRPDVFVSEELTTHFRGEPQAVHVLCYGITGEDHEWLQAHSGDVELCAAYLYEREIACALAHPYYNVGAPLTARHRRRLAELFGIWEIRNGARARELNRPAATYVATRDSIGIGGSDDHAGVDIGRTFTAAPAATTPAEFLAHMRAGRVSAHGKQGSAAKWAHAAIALAARSLGPSSVDLASTAEQDLTTQPASPALPMLAGKDQLSRQDPPAVQDPPTRPDPRRVLNMVQRLLRESDVRHGATGSDLSPADARCLLHAWLSAVELDHLDERGLIDLMQAEDFSHSSLFRRACRLHERKLRSAVDVAVRAATGAAEVLSAAEGLFESCIAAIPYAPAVAFLANERAKLDGRSNDDGETPRVAILTDGIGSMHGVTRTIEEIRRRGVPGFEIEVVGTDPEVDLRLPAVTEIDVPHYPGLQIGVPSLPAAVQTLADGAFDAIHVCSPGPAGIAGVLVARALGLPLIGSYHTELTAYADLRSSQRQVVDAMRLAVGAFYNACDIVLSPSPASDRALAEIGMGAEQVLRWDRGVDTSRFDPSLRDPSLLPQGKVNVLYSGRITREKGADLLADAFLQARAWALAGSLPGALPGLEDRPGAGDWPGGRAPGLNALGNGIDLHLVLAGGGPEQERLAERLGEHATFLGWLSGEEFACVYASADLFLFPSATDTFGQVILEAQASGLPVIAVAEGGPLSLIEDRVTGLLCEASAPALADALLELACSPLLSGTLSRAALSTVRERTWERALERLGEGYRQVVLPGAKSQAGTVARAA